MGFVERLLHSESRTDELVEALERNCKTQNQDC